MSKRIHLEVDWLHHKQEQNHRTADHTQSGGLLLAESTHFVALEHYKHQNSPECSSAAAHQPSGSMKHHHTPLGNMQAAADHSCSQCYQQRQMWAAAAGCSNHIQLSKQVAELLEWTIDPNQKSIHQRQEVELGNHHRGVETYTEEVLQDRLQAACTHILLAAQAVQVDPNSLEVEEAGNLAEDMLPPSGDS